jgi:D-alanyl-D-alanine carboxypeptidase/D-alanyl-D-alanine-endopeptidase (penicillin-binding protein 4)
MSGRLPAAVLSITFLLARHGAPAPASPAPLPFQQTSSAPAAADALPALQQRISTLTEDPSVAAGTWGVAVRSLTTNEWIANVNASRLLTPASSLKVVTLAVAADQLGWDHTFETRVLATGGVSGGTLEGDLVIVGSGDPSLDDWDGAATTLFRTWAGNLRDLGISAIAGRIIGDDRAFPDGGLGSGWAWDDLAFSYSSPAGALQFNQNAAQILAAPAASADLPAIVTLTPPYAGVRLNIDVRTGAPRSLPMLLVQPHPRDRAIDVMGTVPLRSGRLARTIAVANPTLYYATAVREGLRAAGVDVRGEAVDIGDLSSPPELDRATVVLAHRSPLLTSLAETMMMLSQNLYAETLLRTVGLSQAASGTMEAGLEVERKVLANWGVQPAHVHVVDGSGLSRYNLLTPEAMTTVLAHVYADPRLREQFMAALPVGGRSGTLAQRLKRTAAEGNVHAKTGSFSNARAVAGFVRTADREPLAFSIVANNYGVPTDAVDAITDAIIAALAEFARTPR